MSEATAGDSARLRAAGVRGGTPARPVQEGSWPSARTAYYTLFVLILCLTSNQLDIGIVPYLASSIKADLAISDTWLGLLLGAAFGLFYTLIGLPIAYYVDRISRRSILAIGITVWNVGTALCGIAQNFWQLFAARFLVGAGEGVNGPASYAIVGDIFPREKIPRAIALLQLGSVIGPALALLLGAWLLHLFLAMSPIHMPFGIIHGWQLIFILIGLPSVAIAALILFTVPEPARHTIRNQMAEIAGSAHVTGGGLDAWFRDYAAAFRYLRLNWRIYAPMFGSLFAGAFSIGATQWMPIFYQRTFGWGPARLAALQSGAQLTAPLLGLLASVLLAEHFSRRERKDCAYRVYILSLIIALPAMFYVLMPTAWIAFGVGALGWFSIGMSGASQNAALQIITPAELRGKVTALYLLVYSLVGVAFSPVLYALIEDFILRDESLIRWAIFWPLLLFRPLALAIACFGLAPYWRE
ncbi:MAG: MFS transporter, partial [Steroidobacteraceae bacterium]